MPDLKDYVKAQLKAGYSRDTLRQYLISSGYTSKDVDSALAVKHNYFVPVIVVFFVSLIVVLVLLFWPVSSPSFLVSGGGVVSPGSKLSFSYFLDSKGVSLDSLKISVVSNGDVFASASLVPVEGGGVGSITVPVSVPAGSYFLQGVLYYKGGSVNSSFSFRVVEKTSELVVETSNVTSIPKATDLISVVSEIIELAKKDDALAVKKCEELGSSDNVDYCINRVVSATMRVIYCDKISSTKSRDFCFLNYVVTTKDVYVCEKVYDGSARESCYTVV